MGVYIKGMEMPKNCGTCPLRRGDCSQRIYMEKRPDNCPLVPVPPHGRLVDADRLPVSTAVPLDGNSYKYVHLDNIRNAPTIIPASQED